MVKHLQTTGRLGNISLKKGEHSVIAVLRKELGNRDSSTFAWSISHSWSAWGILWENPLGDTPVDIAVGVAKRDGR